MYVSGKSGVFWWTWKADSNASQFPELQKGSLMQKLIISRFFCRLFPHTYYALNPPIRSFVIGGSNLARQGKLSPPNFSHFQ